jgi:hypothetical protein
MNLNNVKLPFGLLDDRLKHIDEVENGRACGCKCPKCNRPLEARNNGTKRAHYFAHYNSEECSGAVETAIHKMAKQIIADEKTILTPIFEKNTSINDLEGNIYHGKNILIEERIVRAESSYLEMRKEGYIPDVILKVDDRYLLIEIYVTHKVDFCKQEKVSNNGDAMMEIDLSRIDSELLLDFTRFKKYVIEYAPRLWIYNPKGESAYEREMLRLRNSIKQIIAEQKRKEAYQQKKQEQRNNYRAIFEERRNDERTKHEKNIKNIAIYNTLSWQNEREKTQRNLLNTYPDVLNTKDAEQKYALPQLVDVKIKSSWIFNIHRSVWQSYILNELIFKSTKGYNIYVHRVKNLVIEHFGVLPSVIELNKLKQEHKRWKKKNQWHAVSGCWFLSEHENRSIPSPYSPIVEYLFHLQKLNIIKYIDEKTFQVSIDRFEKYISMIQEAHTIRQAIINAEIEAKKAEQELKNRCSRQRESEMIASEKRIYEKFNGKGRRCGKCYLFSNQSDDINCPFCGHHELEQITINSYAVDNAIYRYRCSPSPKFSVQNLSVISNKELLSEWLSI